MGDLGASQDQLSDHGNPLELKMQAGSSSSGPFRIASTNWKGGPVHLTASLQLNGGAVLTQNTFRATADRYVERWERPLTQVGKNRLNEAISPPTTEEVTRMVNRIKPKLLRVLTTTDAVEKFMAVLEAALQVPRSS